MIFCEYDYKGCAKTWYFVNMITRAVLKHDMLWIWLQGLHQNMICCVYDYKGCAKTWYVVNMTTRAVLKHDKLWIWLLGLR